MWLFLGIIAVLALAAVSLLFPLLWIVVAALLVVVVLYGIGMRSRSKLSDDGPTV